MPPAGRWQPRPHFSAAVQTCLAELSMEIEGDFSACEDVKAEQQVATVASLSRGPES